MECSFILSYQSLKMENIANNALIVRFLTFYCILIS